MPDLSGPALASPRTKAANPFRRPAATPIRPGERASALDPWVVDRREPVRPRLVGATRHRRWLQEGLQDHACVWLRTGVAVFGLHQIQNPFRMASADSSKRLPE